MPYRQEPRQPRLTPKWIMAWDRLMCERLGHKWVGNRCKRCKSVRSAAESVKL